MIRFCHNVFAWSKSSSGGVLGRSGQVGHLLISPGYWFTNPRNTRFDYPRNKEKSCSNRVDAVT